jgi:citronellyl-CoA dehydrogenase
MWAAANGIGALELMLTDVLKYTHTRKTFGHAIVSNQHVQFKITEWQSDVSSCCYAFLSLSFVECTCAVCTQVEMLRAMVQRCLSEYLAGYNATYTASIAKLKCVLC